MVTRLEYKSARLEPRMLRSALTVAISMLDNTLDCSAAAACIDGTSSLHLTQRYRSSAHSRTVYGLLRISSMPAFRHASRYAVASFAVNATMGTR